MRSGLQARYDFCGAFLARHAQNDVRQWREREHHRSQGCHLCGRSSLKRLRHPLPLNMLNSDMYAHRKLVVGISLRSNEPRQRAQPAVNIQRSRRLYADRGFIFLRRLPPFTQIGVCVQTLRSASSAIGKTFCFSWW